MRVFDRLLDRVLRGLRLDVSQDIDLQRDAFNAITDTLYVGARPQPDDVAPLEEVGITHVVSCLPEDDRADMAFLRRDFATLFVPIHDGVYEDIAANFPTFFDFAAGADTLYVHCEVGVSRSATLATALVMTTRQEPFFEAISRVRARRPGVLPNVGFASQLQRLEHELQLSPSGDAGHSSLARYLHQICKVPEQLDVLDEVLARHDYDALEALHAIFGDDIPRVVQGMRR